jgi:hypothetical protein
MEIAHALVGAFYAVRQSPEQRDDEIDAALDEAELDVDADARGALGRQAARRSAWGAAGGGVGFGSFVAFDIVLKPWLNDASLLSVGAFFVGTAIGHALSALHPVDRPTARSRLSVLQPRGWRDYVPTRYLVAQSAIGAIGAAAVVFGLLVVTAGRPVVDPAHGRAAVILGGLVCIVTATVTAFQRRLLSAPAVAADESHLVANDVVLATALRDLFGAAVGTASITGWVALFEVGAPWWCDVAYIAALLSLRPLIAPSLRPALVPVAHRLAARQQTA